MPFRQRLARHLGESVSNDAYDENSVVDDPASYQSPPPPTTITTPNAATTSATSTADMTEISLSLVASSTPDLMVTDSLHSPSALTLPSSPTASPVVALPTRPKLPPAYASSKYEALLSLSNSTAAGGLDMSLDNGGSEAELSSSPLPESSRDTTPLSCSSSTTPTTSSDEDILGNPIMTSALTSTSAAASICIPSSEAPSPVYPGKICVFDREVVPKKRKRGRPPKRDRCTAASRSAGAADAEEDQPVTGWRRSSRLTKDPAAQLSPEQKYLSYYDVTLTYEDVRALRNDWLTDNNISFWEEYLEREVLPKYPQARIALLRPSLSVLLMNEKTEIARRQLPDFRNITHIFIPITDVKDLAKPEGGTHWSLLLVSTIDGVAFHYDSLGSVNVIEAREATAHLAAVLGIDFRFRNIEDTPQQENGNDCGVFVCVLMRFLLVKRLLNAHAREKVSMSLGGKMIDANGGRKEMLKIIENLRREGERRRSTSPFVRKEVPRIE